MKYLSSIESIAFNLNENVFVGGIEIGKIILWNLIDDKK